MPIHSDEKNIEEIIPNLYIGNYKGSQDESHLKNLKINGIINCTPDYPNIFSDFNYLRIPIKNEKNFEPVFRGNLRNCFDFIDTHLAKNQGVLVHCKNGHRRSASLILYYIMYKFKISENSSKQFIKNKRKHSFPNGAYHF